MCANSMPHPNQSSTPWNAELDAQLVALKAQRLSINKIGKQLRFTRNQVIGRLYRLGLTQMPISAIPEVSTHISSTSFRKIQNLPDIKLPPPRPSLASLFLPLAELQRRACRFPVSGGTCCSVQHLFCGDQTYEASPYCKTHHKLAYYRGYS